MGTVATINVRLPHELKERGGQVLERENISISDLVRELYAYMEKNQEIPEALTPKREDIFEKRRRLIKESVGILEIPRNYGIEQARAERIEARYGEFL